MSLLKRLGTSSVASCTSCSTRSIVSKRRLSKRQCSDEQHATLHGNPPSPRTGAVLLGSSFSSLGFLHILVFSLSFLFSPS